MENKGLIYGAYCTVSKKWYIGKTDRTFDERKDEHINSSFNQSRKDYNVAFHCAIRKYGPENFEWFIIEDNISIPYFYENGEKIYDKTLLNERERYWIKHYKSFRRGYNMTPGGDGGSHHNDISVIQYDLHGNFIAEYYSTSQAERLNNLSKGLIVQGFRIGCKRLGDYMWIKKTTDDYPKHIESYKGHNTGPKPVCQYTLNGVFIKRFDSVSAAAKETGISQSNISHCISGKTKSAGGYLWKFDSDNIKKCELYDGKHCGMKKPVCQYTLDGVFVKRFDSVSAAAKETGLSISYISGCLTNRYKHAGGYIWKYAS